MTEIELYKYITENNIEYHWYEDTVYICPHIFQVEEFVELLPKGIFDDGGIRDIRLFDGYVSIDMNNICDYCGININNVFKKEE
jgi:hypothetical protein